MNNWAFALGNVVGFKLVGKRDIVRMPAAYGIFRIILSDRLDHCTLYVLPYRQYLARTPQVPSEVLSEAISYYGKGAELLHAKFVIPNGEWQPLGVVGTVDYDRLGCARDWWTGEKLWGPKYHPFDQGYTVELQRLVDHKLWRLVLPEGCRITSHGFEHP